MFSRDLKLSSMIIYKYADTIGVQQVFLQLTATPSNVCESRSTLLTWGICCSSISVKFQAFSIFCWILWQTLVIELFSDREWFIRLLANLSRVFRPNAYNYFLPVAEEILAYKGMSVNPFPFHPPTGNQPFQWSIYSSSRISEATVIREGPEPVKFQRDKPSHQITKSS